GFWYVTKPFDVEELRLHLQRATENADLKGELQKLRSEVRHRYHVGNIIGRSPKMEEVFKTVETVAKLRTTVLITGESGTGKELIAKAIHYGSPRAHRPLVTLNCAAIPETLLESELFGHEKGSFTDAHTKKLGQFELAHEGTLLIPYFTQAKAREMNMAEKPFSPEAVDALLRYPWPGNVRELENLVERLLVLTEGPGIGVEDLPEQIRRTDLEPGNIKEQVLE